MGFLDLPKFQCVHVFVLHCDHDPFKIYLRRKKLFVLIALLKSIQAARSSSTPCTLYYGKVCTNQLTSQLSCRLPASAAASAQAKMNSPQPDACQSSARFTYFPCIAFLLLRQVHCSDCGAHITAPVLAGRYIRGGRTARATIPSLSFLIQRSTSLWWVGRSIFSPLEA